MEPRPQRSRPAVVREDFAEDEISEEEEDGRSSARHPKQPRQPDPSNCSDVWHRIKLILSKAETFATCTGEDILVIAVDESGNGQHWGTPAFNRFLKDKRVQALMVKHLMDAPAKPEPVMSEASVEIDHLCALLRQKVASASPYDSMGQFSHEHMPAAWPADVPFCDPKLLSHAQVLRVLKELHLWELAAKVPTPKTKRPRTNEN